MSRLETIIRLETENKKLRSIINDGAVWCHAEGSPKPWAQVAHEEAERNKELRAIITEFVQVINAPDPQKAGA